MIPKQIQTRINAIAGKLLAEGLQPSQYTKAKAKAKTRNAVGKKLVHKIIDGFSPEIKAVMKKMKR